jgi:aryl-alcohol dehydrogenase-like predicted oxidoreductase
MRQRPFGRTGLTVSELGMGCAAIGGGLHARNDRDAIETLHAAYDAGITFYDTAQTYSGGRSEAAVGRAFRDRRGRVILASKAGIAYPPLVALGIRIKPWLSPVRDLLRPMRTTLNRAKYSKRYPDFTPEYLRRSLESSLKRLQTDYIDVYQLHNPPVEVLARPEAMAMFERFKTEGKVRVCGISFKTIDDAESAIWPASVGSIQVEFNLLNQHASARVLPAAQEHGAGVIARVPLAQGLLTDAAEPKAQQIATDPDALARRRRQAEAFRFLADGRRTMAQAALQFVLQQPGVSVVIPGMSSRRHLEANLQALTAPALSPEELGAIARVPLAQAGVV